MLRRYWFTFDPHAGFWRVKLGCGVTATSYDDARPRPITLRSGGRTATASRATRTSRPTIRTPRVSGQESAGHEFRQETERL